MSRVAQLAESLPATKAKTAGCCVLGLDARFALRALDTPGRRGLAQFGAGGFRELLNKKSASLDRFRVWIPWKKRASHFIHIEKAQARSLSQKELLRERRLAGPVRTGDHQAQRSAHAW